MVRAGIFIGVDRTGGLQRLNDAAAGAGRMHAWALSQGLADRTHARLFTDAGGGKVTPDALFTAIAELVDGPGLDQLVVYFAGHGVNINRSEYWLLSDAPRNPNAAVNVAGSVELARYCGIQHVAFISDACRVAPETIQALSVRGSDIFPNDPAPRARPVDQFFACQLGGLAAETKDAAAAATNFSALYTNALLDALHGREASLLERSAEAGDTAAYLKPPRLEQYLEREVPLRVQRMNLVGKVNQEPDAVLSAHDHWLSRIDPAPPARVTRGAPTAPWQPTPETVKGVSEDLVRAVVADPGALDSEVSRVRASTQSAVVALAESAGQLAIPFAPEHLETQCGIIVRGALVRQAFCATAGVSIGLQQDLVWVSGLSNAAATVLVRFDNGTCALVPAFAEFIAALTLDGDELVDVSYEVSQNSTRWQTRPEYRDRSEEVRRLRAVAAAASRHGRFHLDGPGALALATRMQYGKGVDPTLALYAAYAYHDRQERERLTDMAAFMRADVGVTFFDLELLARTLPRRPLGPADAVVPFLPMLGQGWALLGALGAQLHPSLQRIHEGVKDSLWTLYDDAQCGPVLQRLIVTGEVR